MCLTGANIDNIRPMKVMPSSMHMDIKTAWGDLRSRMGVTIRMKINCKRFSKVFRKPLEVASPTYGKVTSTPNSYITD